MFVASGLMASAYLSIFRPLRVGDRAWASRIQTLLCKQPDVLYARVYCTLRPVSQSTGRDLPEGLMNHMIEQGYSFTAATGTSTRQREQRGLQNARQRRSHFAAILCSWPWAFDEDPH